MRYRIRCGRRGGLAAGALALRPGRGARRVSRLAPDVNVASAGFCVRLLAGSMHFSGPLGIEYYPGRSSKSGRDRLHRGRLSICDRDPHRRPNWRRVRWSYAGRPLPAPRSVSGGGGQRTDRQDRAIRSALQPLRMEGNQRPQTGGRLLALYPDGAAVDDRSMSEGTRSTLPASSPYLDHHLLL